MKLFTISILAGAMTLAVSSCGQSAPSEVSVLSKTAMNFNLEGAELGECGLVSQFEKGRATSTQSAGGG